MGEGSAKRKESKVSEEFDRVLGRGKEKKKQSTKETSKLEDSAKVSGKKFENIEANAFYGIMFDESATPEDKKSAMAKALTFEGTKAENIEALKQFETFKEYLQLQRQQMADEFMKLSDTEGFAELQSVIQDMNASLLDFDHQMAPLMEILDAVYSLRTAGEGVMFDAFEEIQVEKEMEEQFLKDIEEQNTKLDDMNEEISALEESIVTKREVTNIFGRTKRAERQEIARMQLKIESKRGDIVDVNSEIERINNEKGTVVSKLDPDLLHSKEKLRELLDITSDGHKERQKALIAAARKFVSTSQERTGGVLTNLEKMSDRTENIIGSNTTLRSLYAIMHEGADDASKANAEKRTSLAAELEEKGDADMIAKMELEEKIGALDNHITAMDTTATDTVATWNDLNNQAANMKNMKDRNNIQIAKTRTLLSSGIGGVADRLVTVLNGVSQAALSESSESMADSLSAMNSRTREFQEKAVIEKVLGKREENDRLSNALEEFQNFGEMVKQGTAAYKEELKQSIQLVEEAAEVAEELRKTNQDASSVHADARDELDQGTDVSNDNDISTEDDKPNPLGL